MLEQDSRFKSTIKSMHGIAATAKLSGKAMSLGSSSPDSFLLDGFAPACACDSQVILLAG